MARVVWMVLVVFCVACGGPGSSKAPTDKTENIEMGLAGGEHECVLTPERQGELMATGILDGTPKPWTEMDFDERFDYMSEVVYPIMAEKFETFDAERFADFSCETCHGEDAYDRNYAQPNPDLMALYPSGSPQQIQVVKTMRPMAVFMFNDVLPTVRDLTGLPGYDAETQTGFSCYSCHPRGK